MGDWFLWLLFLSFAVLFAFSKLKDAMGDNYVFGVVALTVIFVILPINSGIFRLFRLHRPFSRI